MRRSLGIVALLGLTGGAVALANGLTSDAPNVRIPIPAHEFWASVEDNSGTKVDVSQVSYNGEVYFYGDLGLGQAAIPFENIKEIRFEPAPEEKNRVAFVILRNGQTEQVTVKSDTPAYGRTSFGTFTITVDKIKKIDFVASPSSPAAPAPGQSPPAAKP